METQMKAICVSSEGGAKLQSVPRPAKAEPGHLLIKMKTAGINPGDKLLIGRAFPIGLVLSKYDVSGASGAGTIIEAGNGLPNNLTGRNVAIYRSLIPSDHIVGTWSEYAHVHYLDCVLLPDDVNVEDYSGSLVNIITPFAFLEQVKAEGHKGIISTAGTSATGMAMLGICQAYDFPHICLVRTEKAKEELLELGAGLVLVLDDADFKTQLKEMSQQLSATAIFDGVGGAVLNNIVDVIPNGSTIYAYGFLGGPNTVNCTHT